MKIMVAGGAGFIGSHLCDHLLGQGHEVWCLDNLQTGSESNLAGAQTNPLFHFIRGDIRDELPDIDVDQIYNMACPAAPRHYQADPIGTLRTNVIGTLNVLEYCHKRGARMLQASTSEVYGDPNVHPQPEEYVGAVNCTGIRACYDEGKRAAEAACFDYNREHQVEIRVARLFNTYGPRMSVGDGRVIPNFVNQAIAGNPLTVYGAGSQTRSFCYIDDMIDALVRLMNAPGSCVGPINLGNPVEFTVRELATLVVDKTESTSMMVYEDLPADDPRIRRPDITRATTILGWNPVVMLNEGLDQTIAWYRSRLQSAPSKGRVVGKNGRPTLAIIGGGPAGLTAGYSMQKYSKDYDVVILEETDRVGGISRTESYKGYRFDIGGHRFTTQVKQVEAMWHEVLPNDLLHHKQQIRIFYRGKYYDYPLKLSNAFSNLGIYESFRILLSYGKWKLRPYAEETNFEQWITNRFGARLFYHFFKSYTEKVWGMPGTSIRADWAAQRISNMSLRKAVWKAFSGSKDTEKQDETFEYPRLGPGMMWEAVRDDITEKGGGIRMNSSVTRILREDGMIRAIEVTDKTGGANGSYRLEADQFISSMPITQLISSMVPPAPPAVQAAARRLKYRDFVVVTLILNGKDLFPDNWVYIHNPNVQVGRIQNYRSWSDALVPDTDKTSIGMGYFCQEGDEIWNSDEKTLVALAARELEVLGLAKASDVIDGTIIRQPKAFPVYDNEYQQALSMIRGWLADFGNLQLVGRNGMHRNNNQDHSMLT
ncbi:MAG: NAD-dependent epimerase/dehydratase family protein, partial [Sphingobium sp.]